MNPFDHGGGPKTNFVDRRWAARLAAETRIRDRSARFRAAANLDRELMRAVPPLVPYMIGADRVLLSRRVGCFTYQPVFGIDFAALCPRT